MKFLYFTIVSGHNSEQHFLLCHCAIFLPWRVKINMWRKHLVIKMYVFFKSVIKSFPSKIENCSLVFVSLPCSAGLLCRLLSRRFLCLVPCCFGVCFFYLTSILGTAVSSHVLDNPQILCFLKSLYKASFSVKAFRFFLLYSHSTPTSTFSLYSQVTA